MNTRDTLDHQAVEPQHAGMFTSVDHSADPGLFIRLLDLGQEAEDVRVARREVIEGLALEAGNRILDVGCGTGDSSRELACHVDPGGEVVAVDHSRAMVQEATRRHRHCGLPLRFQTGDAQSLPFPSGSFDVARTERMLCHVPDHLAALSEMVRVVRPGGRIAVIEVETGVVLIDHPDHAVNTAFAASLAETIQHPFIGRQLPRLLFEAGLVDIDLRARILRPPYAMLEPMLAHHGTLMVRSGATTPEATTRWRDDLAEAHEAGVLFVGMPIFIALGRKL